jgi:gamma-glutamyltranspeptidase / glutathione hydrolase
MRSVELLRIARAGDPPVEARRGVVSAQHPMAAAVGAEILGGGGNVVDAAVATTFASAVADIGRTGIGGYGGHLVFHDAASAHTWLVDFPSRAPRAAHEQLFALYADRAHTGALAVGVPAVVAGLSAAHVRFGRLGWSDVLQPAIQLAENGIDFGPSGRDPVLAERNRAAAFAETIRVFLDAWDGDHLVQPDLAASLRRLATHGPRELYVGLLADRIVSSVRGTGGLLDYSDLADYEPVVELASRGGYRSVELRTPGAGTGAGVLHPLLRALNDFDLASLEPLGAPRIGLMAEAAGRVWRQRPAPGNGPGCTSHFSVADIDGNVVACTTTLQRLLGSAVTVPGTGILLNNAMALFDPRPGQTNSVGPAKQVITNMCPTVVVREGRAMLSSGASGGRLIPSMLMQAFTLAIDHGFSMDRALRAPRFHHEGDGRLLIEEGLSEAALSGLTAHGYQVDIHPANGTALGGQAPAIWFDDQGRLFGAPDPRRHGAAVAV